MTNKKQDAQVSSQNSGNLSYIKILEFPEDNSGKAYIISAWEFCKKLGLM
jgi:hypothetical protein